MPSVNFYVLSEGEERRRLQVTCRIAEKAWRLGRRVYIHSQSAAQQRQLDDLLWSYPPTSFLPHACLQGDTPPDEVVTLGVTPPPIDFDDVLINLSAAPCEHYQRFSRVNEIVAADEDSVAAGREWYRFYRSHGITPETHKL